MTWLRVVAILAVGGPRPVAAQSPGLVVTVTSAETRAPIPGGSVLALRVRQIKFTDRLGRARFEQLSRPETLLVTAVAFRPETVFVDVGMVGIAVSLTPQPVTLAGLTVTGDRTALTSPAITGRWMLPGMAIGSVPPAVEVDPLRALAVVPSISFSSPLSARPIIRGYDAAESVVRLDGFEIINPYHIGRVFSNVPADAVESMAVSPAPGSVEIGGTLGGGVDIHGRSSGRRGQVTGGINASLLSLAGWLGADAPVPGFLAARVASLTAVTEVTGQEVPYEFVDAYARTRLPLGGARSWELSFFGSRDEFSERDAGRGMDWSNLLLGSRWRLLDGPAGSLDVTASINSFALDASDVETRNSRVDVSNMFRRVGAETSGELGKGPLRLRLGGGLSSRRMETGVVVRSGDDVDPFAQTSRLTDAHGFLEAAIREGRWTVRVGARVDGSADAVAVQPRALLSVELLDHAAASIQYGRASRLYQLITDPQPEPAVSFYDFWFNAGADAVPVPRVDHVAVSVDAHMTSWSLYGAAFWSSGDGIGELRPVTDQQAGVPAFRFGQSRVVGFEGRAGWQSPAGRTSAVLSYVLSKSERRWEDGRWVSWHLDRRHQVRLQAETMLGTRWRLFALGEFFSGQPITPVEEVAFVEPPPVGGDISQSLSRLVYRFGREGSARSDGVFHADLGIRLMLGGPGDSRISLGFSVLNVGFGPVAPEEPVQPQELIRQDGTFPPEGVRYERRFSIPAVPSFTARIEF